LIYAPRLKKAGHTCTALPAESRPNGSRIITRKKAEFEKSPMERWNGSIAPFRDKSAPRRSARPAAHESHEINDP